MRNKILYLLAFVLFFSCKEDESNYFDVDMTDLQVSFEPIPGGAYLNYKLPANTDVYAIQAKYKDLNGKDMLIKGTYSATQMKLFGFNAAQSSVPVEISLIDKNENVSDVLNKTFSTLPSAAVAVFDVLEVKSGWNGFRISYPGLGSETEGVLNIFTVGIDPKTQKLDTILLDTTPLQSTDFVYNYTDAADTVNSCVVVLRADDYRGNIAKREVYEATPVRATQIPQANLDLIQGSSWEIEDPNYAGEKYLFDGDKIGWQNLQNSKGTNVLYYAFLSVKDDQCVTATNAADPESTKNVWTFDLSAEEEVASVRVYSSLYARIPGNTGAGLFPMNQTARWYLPNNIEIYGTNNPNATIAECDTLGSYSEYQSLSEEYKWIYPAVYNDYGYAFSDLDKFKQLDPNYLEIAFEVTGNKYRYIKIKVFELFEYSINSTEYVPSQLFMQEFEVYKKLDDASAE
ncbi:MAG: DUF4959 domain-containing protein [Mangrovibacterium sp.]